MRIPRIHTDEALSTAAELTLAGNAAHHAGRVLRMKAGRHLILCNGDGRDYRAEILESGGRSLRVRILDATNPGTESTLDITLGQVMSRGERMDYAIQKATELGVTRIQPLTSERCEVRLSGERKRKRVNNWQQMVISAAEQCGRARFPNVATPLKLDDWLSGCDHDLQLVLHEQGQPFSGTGAAPGSIALLVGPEGGLNEREVELARGAGFQPLVLGPRTLRTETATVTVLSLCQWIWGDFQSPDRASGA